MWYSAFSERSPSGQLGGELVLERLDLFGEFGFYVFHERRFRFSWFGAILRNGIL
jgi:hypothetical protein